MNFGSVDKFVIGSEEWCSLPDLDLKAIKVRVDSGAKTSALHAVNITPYTEDHKEYVRFEVHPIQGNRRVTKICKAMIVGKRLVKSSNGLLEKRYVIISKIQLGHAIWDIEITLTNRDSMGYRMLLGREAMKNKVLVDPDSVFIVKKISDKMAIKYYNNVIDKNNALNIILLASNKELYSNKRIIEAAESRGHNISFINVSKCYIKIKSGVPEIYDGNGMPLKDIDAVIPRLRPSMTSYGCALIRQFQALGSFCLNGSLPIINSRDKLKCLQILAARGIDLPITIFSKSSDNIKDLIKSAGGVPIIIKLLEGTQGKGVVLAETINAATSVIGAFNSTNTEILIQEFIREADGSDIRCFVVDDKIVAAMQRRSTNNDFRSNLHLGGSAMKVKLSQAEIKMAIQAVQSIGLKVAGVDILRSNKGPKVIEVNSSPGLEGIESISKIDIASLMIESIERHIYGE